MVQKITPEERLNIINIANAFELKVQLRDDGTEYEKQIRLVHTQSGQFVFVDKERDSRHSGFKVCVHPKRYIDSVCNENISLWKSTKTDPRLSPHSAFKGFPIDITISKEPLGTCYRVKGQSSQLSAQHVDL